MKIGIIDYGMGNIRSIENALRDIENINCLRPKTDKEFEACDVLILPGVGAFKPAISRIRDENLDVHICRHVEKGKKLIGICLGMQLLFDRSQENGCSEGLGFIAGSVTRLEKSNNRFEKVPCIGWREVQFNLDHGNKYDFDSKNFYFVHSFHVNPLHKSDILATYSRNESKVVAAVRKQNIIGVQFHPERSGKSGLKLLSWLLSKGI